MNKRVKRKNQCGFTLIEIMIAITIFAIGILAVAAMQIGAVKGNSSASGLTEATMAAQNRMEQLMSLNYNNPILSDADNDGIGGLNDTVPPDTASSADGTSQYTGATSAVYNVFWNVAVNSPVNNTKQIRVIVKWTQNGGSRTVILNSVKSLTE